MGRRLRVSGQLGLSRTSPARVLAIGSLLLVGLLCTATCGTSNRKLEVADSEIEGDWVMEPNSNLGLRLDLIKFGVPRLRLGPGNRLAVRSFPKRFDFFEPPETALVDRDGYWHRKGAGDLFLMFEDGSGQATRMGIVMSGDGTIRLVGWRVEPGEGGVFFSKTSISK
jgi:hypothetical protein